MSNENVIIEKWVFTGHRLKNGKTSIIFRELVAGEMVKQRTFEVKKRPVFAVGGIYEVRVHRDDGENITVELGTVKYIGQYGDDDAVRYLKAEQQIANKQAEMAALERKHASGFELPVDDWSTLVEMYDKLHHMQRVTFEQMILSRLRSDRESLKRNNK